MAENPIATETENEEIQTQAPENTDANAEVGEDAKKMVPAIAVHQARQEAKREREARVRLEQELKASKLSTLPEDEQIDQGFIELTSTKVMSQVDQEAFEKLPTPIKDRLKTNPWAFVDEATIKKETRFADGRPDYYNIMGRLAKESIDSILKDSGLGNPQQDKKQEDPSTNPGTNPVKEPQGYSEAELLILSQKDPEKFSEIRRSLMQR